VARACTPALRNHRQVVGQRSEAAAADYLVRAGLRPLAANARARLGELDLVMLDEERGGDVLVFIEVRYRKYSHFGGGAASVDGAKQRRLVRAAQVFLARHPQYHALPCRFDVIAASGDADAPELDWIRNAFAADG